MMELDALDRLINAVAEYVESLKTNIGVLNEAADVCDQAMGSDDISQKYIGQLDQAVEELDKTKRIAENVVYALQEDKLRAMKTFED